MSTVDVLTSCIDKQVYVKVADLLKPIIVIKKKINK